MMKRVLIPFLVAIITIVILLLIYNPGLLENIWLWVIGLIGSIVALIQQGWKWIQRQIEAIQNKSLFKKKGIEPEKTATSVKSGISKESSTTNHQLTLLRLVSDDDSTLGILFYAGKFYCYTMEDYCTDQSIICRIPSGVYQLGFLKNSHINKEYELKINNFQGHLHVKGVPPVLTGIIHFGGLGMELNGDIVLTDITENQNPGQLIQQSKTIFENLYHLVSNSLIEGETITIEVFDETWFKEKIN